MSLWHFSSSLMKDEFPIIAFSHKPTSFLLMRCASQRLSVNPFLLIWKMYEGCKCINIRQYDIEIQIRDTKIYKMENKF